MYSLIDGNQITAIAIRPPRVVSHSGRDWDTREGAPDRDHHLAQVGIVPRVSTERPADTDTHTHDGTWEIIDGQVVRVWTEREWTEQELFAREQAAVPSIADVVAARLVAADNDNPPVWFAPQGAHDAWLPGAIVLHPDTGDRHLNELPIPNVWGLTVHGWRNLDAWPPDPDPDGTLPWVEGDSFLLGDRRSYDGAVYECITPHTAWPGTGWTPPTSPSLWTLVE